MVTVMEKMVSMKVEKPNDRDRKSNVLPQKHNLYLSTKVIDSVAGIDNSRISADSGFNDSGTSADNGDCNATSTYVDDTEVPRGRSGVNLYSYNTCVENTEQMPLYAKKDDCADDGQMRRYRTAFTREQIERLEKEFTKENYVSRPKRCEMAANLRLPESTIKVWFQNRRMKDKRQRLAVSWPYGIADPQLYAYIAAAANYSAYLGAPLTHHLASQYPSSAAMMAGMTLPASALPGLGMTLPLSPPPSACKSASEFLMPPPSVNHLVRSCRATLRSPCGTSPMNPGISLRHFPPTLHHPSYNAPAFNLSLPFLLPNNDIGILQDNSTIGDSSEYFRSQHVNYLHTSSYTESPTTNAARQLTISPTTSANNHTASGRNTSTSVLSASCLTSLSCSAPTTVALLHSARSISMTSKTKHSNWNSSIAPNGLFRPFQSEVEKGS